MFKVIEVEIKVIFIIIGIFKLSKILLKKNSRLL